MSYYDTKQALISHFMSIAITGLDAENVAVENEFKDFGNADLCAALYFIPSTSEPMGKANGDSDERRGVFQISVFVALNSDNRDNTQLQAIDEIVAGFKNNTVTTYGTESVQILESTVTSGSSNDAWFRRDISINYLTFSNRG
jgi:hypothetical protein